MIKYNLAACRHSVVFLAIKTKSIIAREASLGPNYSQKLSLRLPAPTFGKEECYISLPTALKPKNLYYRPKLLVSCRTSPRWLT